MHSALETANFVVDYCVNVRGGNTRITNLQLQKILFFIQCAYCKQHDGGFLFDDDFEAWKYGPVVPAVYYEYSIWGGLPIDGVGSCEGDHDAEFSESDKRTILLTVEKWIDKDPWTLVAASHKEDAPWYLTYNGGSGLKGVIEKRLIRSYACK